MKIVATFATLIAVIAVFLLVTNPASVLLRTNILVGSSPITIWSWDKQDGTFTIVQLSSDIATDVPGYGRYTLEALWKLGFIDKKAGTVLARGLTDALSLPIHFFIGEKTDSLIAIDDPIAYGKKLFSPKGLFSFLFRRRVSNMSIGNFASLAWALSRARPDSVHLVDFVVNAPVARENLPDGSTREFIDPERTDVLLKGRFEDERVRRENLTVGVYNTTSIPALGTQAARVLATLGVLVVAVGNSEPKLAACRIEGKPAAIRSKTADVIAELLGCRTIESENEERVDLAVYLGTDYASR